MITVTSDKFRFFNSPPLSMLRFLPLAGGGGGDAGGGGKVNAAGGGGTTERE